VVAVGAAIAVGVGGIGGGAGTGGTAADSAGAASGSSARVTQGKQAARNGRSDDAWRSLRLRKVREAAERAANCAVNSYGQVRDFFLRNPCRSLDRMLFTLADPAGNTFVVSVSWVGLRRRGDVRDLKQLIDEYGTGSVAPLGFSVLRDQGVRFTGKPFRSRPDGRVLVVAEGAKVAGHPDEEFFTTVVEVAAELRR
jgi:hypothetical protein